MERPVSVRVGHPILQQVATSCQPVPDSPDPIPVLMIHLHVLRTIPHSSSSDNRRVVRTNFSDSGLGLIQTNSRSATRPRSLNCPRAHVIAHLVIHSLGCASE